MKLDFRIRPDCHVHVQVSSFRVVAGKYSVVFGNCQEPHFPAADLVVVLLAKVAEGTLIIPCSGIGMLHSVSSCLLFVSFVFG